MNSIIEYSNCSSLGNSVGFTVGWALSFQYHVDGSISKDTPNPLPRTAARNFFM